MRKSGTNTQPMEPDCETVRRWKEFSERYESKVFSVTSFPARRQKILRGVLPGIVADLGCGPLGLMLREICGLANTVVIGTDFCWEMLVESKRHTKECDVHYVLADNRCLPFQDRSIDTVVSVNSFLPESREEVESIFQQVARVLRRGGRLVALLPSFEMSLIARDKWEMPLRLDLDNHREWDTSGWQCFYTRSDIDELAQRHGLHKYRVERVVFSTLQEVNHLRRVYGESVRRTPIAQMLRCPLFEHLLIAER